MRMVETYLPVEFATGLTKLTAALILKFEGSDVDALTRP